MRQVRFMVMVLLLAAAAPFAQVSADVALRAAMEKETVDGDLKGAIAAYKKIVDGYRDNRAARAQALLRMAECYQKLGDAQATEIYRRIIREFGDQTAQAAIARSKVAQPSRGGSEFTIRRVDSSPTGVDDISLDGAKVAFTDWENGNIAIREVGAAQMARITTQTAYTEFGEMPVFSPDGTQIAYSWCTKVGVNCHGYLHIARAVAGQGTSARVVFAGEAWTQAYDWSPDGKHIAVVVTRKNGHRDIASIAVADGTIRTLRVIGQGKVPRRMLFSPDGKYLAFDTGLDRGGAQEGRRDSDVFVLAMADGRERPVAIDPSHSLVAGWSPDGTRVLFTSDSGGTVDLYSATVSAGDLPGRAALIKSNLGPIAPLRIGTSGALYFATQSGGGTHVAQAAIDFSTGQMTAGGTASPLDAGIGMNRGPQWSPDGESLAYVHRRAETPQAHSSIMIRSTRTGNTRELRPDLTTVQQLHWSRDSKAIYTIGADGRGEAGLFRVDVATGASARVIAAARLTAFRIDRDGRAYSFSSTGNRHGFVQYDLAAGTQVELFAFEATGGQAAYQVAPDGSKVYYRRPQLRPQTAEGTPALAGDSIVVERDIKSGTERELVRGRIPFLLLSPDGKYLGMRRVNGDGTHGVAIVPTTGEPVVRDLMRYEMTTGANLAAWAPDSQSVIVNKPSTDASKSESWWVPLAGRAPQKLARFMGNIHVHPDGKVVAFQFGSAEPQRTEVWAMEHFLPAPVRK